MSIMRRLVGIIAKRKHREIEQILNHPIEIMEKKLYEILHRHKCTNYGKAQDFGGISSEEEFRNSVALSDSQSIKKYLYMTYNDPQGKVLTADDVIWYLQTSGTTGEPKKLPITKTSLREVSKGTMLSWLAFINADPENSKILDGKLLTFGAPAMLDHINGIPVGYATGVYAQFQNRLFQRLIVPGERVFNIRDMEEKLWEYSKISVKSNITALQGITTLSLALVRRMQNLYGHELAREFAGTETGRKISQALSDDGHLDLNAIWPDLRLFVATGVDTDPYREWINDTFQDVTIWEMYGGSEGFYGGQLLLKLGVQLMPNLNYYEFIPQSEVDSEEPTVVPLSEVKKGYRYEMVITNLNGYVRYRTGDMMTFTSTDPYTVRGIARKGRVVNLSGEKVSEAHINKSIHETCRKTGYRIQDYTVIGVVENGVAHYSIAVMFEHEEEIDPIEFVSNFEGALGEINLEFKLNRETGALGPTRLYRMKSSLFEEVIEKTHLQAKPKVLTDDSTLLATCEQY